MRESRESKWMGAPASPPVVVLGAGFAGLRAVRRLGRAGVATLWVDARNYHCFLPLLYQVATAGLEPQDIAYPARSILRRLRAVDFRLARVAAGDPAAQTLATASGERIAYSHLIVCTGGAAEDFGIPGVREHAFHLYDLDDARALRNHVLRTLDRDRHLGGGHPRGAGRSLARAPDRAERAPRGRADAPGPRLPGGVRRRGRGAGRGRGASATGGAGGHPAGRAGGGERAARAPRRAAPSLPLRRQRRDGDHRAESCRCGGEGRALAGPPRLVGLARRAPRHADRLPQSPGRAGELGVELLHLRPGAACHRRRGGRGGRARDESARTRLTRRARGQGTARTLRGVDLNHRPRGYEPRELPGCSTPRQSDERRLPIRAALPPARRGRGAETHPRMAPAGV